MQKKVFRDHYLETLGVAFEIENFETIQNF